MKRLIILSKTFCGKFTFKFYFINVEKNLETKICIGKVLNTPAFIS